MGSRQVSRRAASMASLLAIGLLTMGSPPALAKRHALHRPVAPQADPVAKGAPLNANDVSWLFPPPRQAADLANLVSISDLTAPSVKDPSQREQIWPDDAFRQFIADANALVLKGPSADHAVKLPQAFENKAVWHVAGLRIDPGAPGLTPAIMDAYGQQPQIRFILQPVTQDRSGKVQVHDVAAHVIFSFIAGADAPKEPGCLPRPKPDMDAFKKVAQDFAALRDRLNSGEFGGVKVATNDALLGVHPGLANPKTARPLRDALVEVLQRHLSAARFSGMAVMAIPAVGSIPEPWIFEAMGPDRKPAPAPALTGAQFAEGLAVQESPEVIPTPATNNLNPITCRNNLTQGPAALPANERKGLATAALFDFGDDKLQDAQKIATVRETVNLIPDPTRSHFFNTDCVSCHTDTRRALDLLGDATIPGVAKNVLPQEKWNVRNFGWFPSFLHSQRPVAATATRRTAAETAAVVDFINKNGLAK